ncbi:MAG: type IX secretion system protein PorQ [Rhodothermia bacterium]|nr:type IX secretion system protein PorQ [Rhodothermia bacterium]
MKRTLFALLFFLFPFVLSAQPSLQPTSFSFLRIEPSARAMAMGGAYAGMSGDVNTFFYNPATLEPSSAGVLSASALLYLADARSTSGAYAHHLPKVGTVAVGLRAMDYGALEEACPDGNEYASCIGPFFSAGDVAITAGISRDYSSRLRYGMNVHGIWSRIAEYRASAVAADLGVVYHNDEGGFTASASMLNVGKTLDNLGETADELPTDLRIGVSQKLKYMPFTLSVMAYNLLEWEQEQAITARRVLNHFSIGGEFRLGTAMNFRLGYNPLRNEMLRVRNRLDMAGLGVGFGIKIAQFRLDYGYNNWSSAGKLHQFTAQFRLK